VGVLGRHVWNEAEFTNQLAQIRGGLSLFGSDKTPATGWLRQFAGLFMDTPADRRKVKAAGVITDWYDSDEAKQFFRQNPKLFVRATQSAEEAIKLYRELKTSGGIVPTKLPGGGVSLPYDPKTGTVSVIPEEADARRSEAFAAEVSPELLASVIQVESGGDPKAISPKGAKGLMQVLDSTNAKPGYGVTPARDNSAAERRRVGRDYLGAMLLLHEGNVSRALAAYNWGPGAVDKWINKGADISKLPTETKNFIQRVKNGMSTVTPQQVGQAQALGASAAPTTSATVDIRQGRRSRTIEDPAGVATPGSPKSVAKQIVLAPDLSKIKEPDIKMPFGLQAQEINTLMTSRRALASQLRSLRGRPGSLEFLKTRALLTANTGMIQNMSQTQALNKLQLSNDPRQLNAILNRQNPGSNIQITPNSDGTFRVEMGGRVIAERKDKGKLISELRRKNSIELHKALNSAAAGATLKANEAALKSIFEIRALITKGEYDKAIQKMKQAGSLFKGIDSMFRIAPDGVTSQILQVGVGVNDEVTYTWTNLPGNSGVTAASFKRNK
jgi:hypothetical protein